MSDKIQAPYPAQSTLIATAICVTRCDINFQRCIQTVHTEQHQKKIKRKIWVIALAFVYHYVQFEVSMRKHWSCRKRLLLFCKGTYTIVMHLNSRCFFSMSFFSQVDFLFLSQLFFRSRLFFHKSNFFFKVISSIYQQIMQKLYIMKYKMMCVKWMKGPVYCEKWTPPRHCLWQRQDFRLLFLEDITKKARGTSGWCWEKNWCRRKSGGTNDDVFP